jgi:hypothetical protein
MDLSELKHLIQTTRWFSNLGRGASSPGIIAVNDLGLFQRFIATATAEECGLADKGLEWDLGPMEGMEWLPGTVHEPDPIHGQRLAELADQLGRTQEYREERLKAFKLAQQALRTVPEIPEVNVGPTQLEPVARGAALFAARLAASEIVVGEPGFWCAMVRHYHQGHWPMGRNLKGEVIIL